MNNRSQRIRIKAAFKPPVPPPPLPSSSPPESSPTFEASLSAKEKIISELHTELHALETTLAQNRLEHLAELRKLHAVLDDKVGVGGW